jgi:hypothetical protein
MFEDFLERKAEIDKVLAAEVIAAGRKAQGARTSLVGVVRTALVAAGELGVCVRLTAPSTVRVYHPQELRSEKAPSRGDEVKMTEREARKRGLRRCTGCCEWEIAEWGSARVLLGYSLRDL